MSRTLGLSTPFCDQDRRTTSCGSAGARRSPPPARAPGGPGKGHKPARAAAASTAASSSPSLLFALIQISLDVAPPPYYMLVRTSEKSRALPHTARLARTGGRRTFHVGEDVLRRDFPLAPRGPGPSIGRGACGS